MRNSRKVSIVSVKLTQIENKSQEKSHLGPVILYFLEKNKETKTYPWKRSHLAKELKVKRSTVTEWIKGKHGFTLEHLGGMLKTFKINLLEFAIVANECTSWGKFNPASKK